MALTVGDRAVRPLTAKQALRMLELGILDEGERVELLDGVLTEKPVKSPAHEAVKARLVAWLDPAGNRERFELRIEACLVVADPTSLPEPDLMLVAPGGRGTSHPSAALLVIEVAVSSLRLDLGRKLELYGATGVPEYWVVDVPSRRVRVFAEPGATTYGVETIAAPPARLAARAVDVAPLDLAELFAEL